MLYSLSVCAQVVHKIDTLNIQISSRSVTGCCADPEKNKSLVRGLVDRIGPECGTLYILCVTWEEVELYAAALLHEYVCTTGHVTMLTGASKNDGRSRGVSTPAHLMEGQDAVTYRCTENLYHQKKRFRNGELYKLLHIAGGEVVEATPDAFYGGVCKKRGKISPSTLLEGYKVKRVPQGVPTTLPLFTDTKPVKPSLRFHSVDIGQMKVAVGTVYSSQGKEFQENDVVYLGSRVMPAREFLVGVSRARGLANVYVQPSIKITGTLDMCHQAHRVCYTSYFYF